MRVKRLLRLVAAAGLVALVAVGGVTVVTLRGSLPRLDGQVPVAGLSGPVTVSRDDLGCPTVVAATRADLAYATGYLHAQDRFFQMDLMRRVAAGELSALFGPAALPSDRERRLFRLRSRAAAVVASLPSQDRLLIDRYVAGVNAGLEALGVRPFEYVVLGQAPVPWRAEDSFLTGWAMYFSLQGHFNRKLGRAWLRDHATAAQLAFLLPASTRFDAPLDGMAVDEPAAPVPDAAPDWFGRSRAGGIQGRVDEPVPSGNVGSNNWALAGTRSLHGAAIVSNDMHLGLQLPANWYRAVLSWPGEDGVPRRLTGVTLPGLPALIAGSNGYVAWGFTNSYADTIDLILLERDPADARRFRLGEGWAPVTSVVEHIDVKGQAGEDLVIEETPLGPVRRMAGRDYAVHWIGAGADAINLGLMAFEQARDVGRLLDAANRAGLPAQNIVAGDRNGHIGWSIAGSLPGRRWTTAAGFPYPSSDPAPGWRGLRKASDYPRIEDPAGGALWTANSRQIAGSAYDLIGDGGPDLGARTHQIMDDLKELGARSDEKAVYAIALDDRARFLAPWRDRALAVLTDNVVAGHPERAEFRRLLREDWSGRAEPASVGYRLAHDFLSAYYAELFGGLDDALAKDGVGVTLRSITARWPAVAERLADSQPAGWLPNGRANWRQVGVAAVDAAIADLTRDGEVLAKATWGSRNTAHIAHPFTRFAPWLRAVLAAPPDPLPGDVNMPRVAMASFGQSERMVVAPGHEDLGIFNMPGGQSGHPLSPYFLAGYEDWVAGRATPLLPGPERHRLVFVTE